MIDILMMIIGGSKARESYRDHTQAISDRTQAVRELASAMRERNQELRSSQEIKPLGNLL